MNGRTELVYLPEELFQLVEGIRNKLGMNRSAFYRHCIMTYLESKSLVSTHLKQTSHIRTKALGVKPGKRIVKGKDS
jgi:metal-responsive CopG/Arc/MetJ family transcriptional regulator